MSSRAKAAKVIASVVNDRRSLDAALSETLSAEKIDKERAFIQELSYGVLRWYHQLDFILGQQLTKPLARKNSDIKALLLCGLYQLDFLRTPDHAAVSASVEATVYLKKKWAKQMVNAVLRRYQRERPQIQHMVKENNSACFSCPDWLISSLQHDWPEHWEKILNAYNEHPPMHIRVNRQHGSRQKYIQELNAAGIAAEATELVDDGIRLTKPIDVDLLPGFSQGHISVQDFGAQLAAPLLDPRPGHHVLDACSAPGGKAAHIYESEPAIERLVAIESDKRRICLLEETNTRIKAKMNIVHADVRNTESWWDGRQFDRILLDVPCSATGVIRRHPDIKLLREAGSIPRYGKIQYEILNSVWPLLKGGGKLLYITCSLLRQENDQIVGNFLENHTDTQIVEFDAQWGTKTAYGRQTLPGQDDADGFYYAVMIKNNDNV